MALQKCKSQGSFVAEYATLRYFFHLIYFTFYDIGLPLIILINDFSHTLQHIVIQLVTVLLSFTRSHKIYDISYSSNRDFTCASSVEV